MSSARLKNKYIEGVVMSLQDIATLALIFSCLATRVKNIVGAFKTARKKEDGNES